MLRNRSVTETMSAPYPGRYPCGAVEYLLFPFTSRTTNTLWSQIPCQVDVPLPHLLPSIFRHLSNWRRARVGSSSLVVPRFFQPEHIFHCSIHELHMFSTHVNSLERSLLNLFVRFTLVEG